MRKPYLRSATANNTVLIWTTSCQQALLRCYQAMDDYHYLQALMR